LETDNSLFCYRDIPTIHNGYCVSNAVDYARENDVLPMILSTELKMLGLYLYTLIISHKFRNTVVIRGYVPQGAGFYTRYCVYVIQWQRALVVYMSLGQLES